MRRIDDVIVISFFAVTGLAVAVLVGALLA
jgi:hypothetical protein